MNSTADDLERSPRLQSRAAFTFLELLIVLALIGMFTAIFVMNFDSMLRQTDSEAVQSTFWRATQEARTRALVTRKTESLRFDKDALAFVIEESGGANAARFPIDQKKLTPDSKIEIALMKRLSASQFSLVAGKVVDLREIPSALFFPDGTCTPFVLSTKIGQKESSLEIDPWTGAALLASDEK